MNFHSGKSSSAPYCDRILLVKPATTVLGLLIEIAAQDHFFFATSHPFRFDTPERRPSLKTEESGKFGTQLPSPSYCPFETVLWYTDLQIPISHMGLVHSGRHPNNSMPMTGVLMGYS